MFERNFLLSAAMLMIERHFFPSQNFNLYEKGYENYLYEKLMLYFCKTASNTDISHGKVQLHDCIWHGELLAKVLEVCHHSYVIKENSNPIVKKLDVFFSCLI